MKKEQSSISTEVPKLKPALLDKIEAEKEPEVDLSKKKILNYQNRLDGEF